MTQNPKTYEFPALYTYRIPVSQEFLRQYIPKSQWTWWHVLMVYGFLGYYLYQTWEILGEVFYG